MSEFTHTHVIAKGDRDAFVQFIRNIAYGSKLFLQFIKRIDEKYRLFHYVRLEIREVKSEDVTTTTWHVTFTPAHTSVIYLIVDDDQMEKQYAEWLNIAKTTDSTRKVDELIGYKVALMPSSIF